MGRGNECQDWIYIHLVRANTKANEAHPSDRCYDMNWNKKYHSSYSIQINKCMGKIYSDAIRSTIKGYVYEDMQQIIYHNVSFVVSLLSIRRCLFAKVSYFYTCLLFVLAKKTIVTLTEQMTHAHEKKVARKYTNLNLIQVFCLWLSSCRGKRRKYVLKTNVNISRSVLNWRKYANNI